MSKEKKEKLKNYQKKIIVRLKSFNLINKTVLIAHVMIYTD